jgi:hypothetical protein
MNNAPQLAEIIRREGFAFAPQDDMRVLLEASGSLADWDAFAASWNDLATDTYMADRGRYRKRRHAIYKITPSAIQREAHQPHYQTLDYNHLNGGVERWFEPIDASVGDGPSMKTILHFCHRLFDICADHRSPTTGHRSWRVETHQFRIEAKTGEHGQPTPEGLHRDGVDYVLVLLIRRDNIQSGVTTIHDLNKKEVGSFTLTQPFDAALVDDNRVYHGVTAVTPLDPAKPAYRDVLVVTFKKAD